MTHPRPREGRTRVGVVQQVQRNRPDEKPDAALAREPTGEATTACGSPKQAAASHSAVTTRLLPGKERWGEIFLIARRLSRRIRRRAFTSASARTPGRPSGVNSSHCAGFLPISAMQAKAALSNCLREASENDCAKSSGDMALATADKRSAGDSPRIAAA